MNITHMQLQVASALQETRYAYASLAACAVPLLRYAANIVPYPSFCSPNAVCRVLGALPWLPFADPSDRWNLAADALTTVRMALTAGAEGMWWCARPKGLGPPRGILVTVLAARMVHHLAIAGGLLLRPPLLTDLLRCLSHLYWSPPHVSVQPVLYLGRADHDFSAPIGTRASIRILIYKYT